VEARSVAVRARAAGRNKVMSLDEVKRLMVEEATTKSVTPLVVPPAAPVAETQEA
jgi:hypothetical protein